MSDTGIEIAIIGTPNCGKTTLFNRLTGARQRTGNWAGVTVERKDGRILLPSSRKANLVDLPGVYSLKDDIQGIEAKVAHNYLLEQAPNLVILVLDATRLPRQLCLLPDLVATGCPILIAVNMLDTAKAEGIEVDLAALGDATGLPVCGVVASSGEGIDALKAAIENHIGTTSELPTSRTSRSLDIAAIAQQCFFSTGKTSRTERIDSWILKPYIALPTFLAVMYLLFTLSVNLGAVFIDFFDILLGAIFVDGSAQLLSAIGSPQWTIELVSSGIGGGIQLVGTFIPVIGFLYLFMSALEDSGYLSRAAFVIDRVMAKIGLPGQAFIPLIIGFGCNVPSVMASRGLSHIIARLTTIFIAPFMSCGARLSVYVFVGTAFFPQQAQNAIFALYLLGIAVAIISAWILRKSVFRYVGEATISEMPAYHRPLIRNVVTQTWHRLYSFIWRAGKRILFVVVILNLLSSFGTDGSWGNQQSDKSLLAATGRVLTPIFVPMGIGDENWQATVGLFTGLFAKEVVVGTLDTLYQIDTIDHEPTQAPPSFLAQVGSAFASIADNGKQLASSLADPLGISAAQRDASEIGFSDSVAAMHAAFPSAWSAFCYLVFILLYAPCVATLGAMQREAGQAWLSYSVGWSLLLSYWLASLLWQASQIMEHTLFASAWILAATALLYFSYRWILYRMRRSMANHIPVVNLS